MVKNGWLAYAELRNGKATIRIVRSEDGLFISGSTPHNIYLPEGTGAHTMKFGKIPQKIKEEAKAMFEIKEISEGRTKQLIADWNPAPELDALVKHPQEEDIFKMAQVAGIS